MSLCHVCIWFLQADLLLLLMQYEVMRLRESGIPVVVSMGNQATSGGYEISGQSCPSHVSFSASHQAQSTTQPICAHRHTWEDVLSPNSISMIICFVNTQRVLPGLAVHVWLHPARWDTPGFAPSL